MEDTQRLPDHLCALAEHLSATTAQLADADGFASLTDEESLRVIAVAEQIKAAAAAVQARVTTAFVAERDADAKEARSRGEINAREASQRRSAARAEVALARRCSPFQADRHVAHARALCTDLPLTMAALTAGELSEHRAAIVAQETSCLTPEDRQEVDTRMAEDLTRLGDKVLTATVQRVCIDVDQASIVERRRRAAADRHVGVGPAPDGMARLTVLGPLTDVVGAYASLRAAEAARWVATGDPEVDAARAGDDRGRGAWLADTALEWLSGRAPGQAQPVEVSLVMSDTALFPAAGGSQSPGGSQSSSTGQPQSGAGRHRSRGEDQSAGEDYVEVPGWGAIPAADARDHLLRLLDEHEGGDEARIWLRRLFTSPDGRNLVAMDSRRRFFTGALRSLIELRDPTCRIPWCGAPTRQIDHARPAADDGPTSVANGLGLCQRHNLTKESPGWDVTTMDTGHDPGGGAHTAHITTPTGDEYTSVAPPLLGHGRVRGRPPRDARRDAHPASMLEAHLERLLRAAA